MNVFLSHSTKDKDFVLQLANELLAVDIQPWLCEVEIEYGDNFVAAIEKGLREADVALLIWSPNAARSGWTEVEWTSVLAREVAESRIRLGFLLLGDAEVPELLRTKHRIDAREDQDRALREAVNWLIRMREMRKTADTMAPRSFLDVEPPDFVGRADHLERLYGALADIPARYLLWGEPGCGKSTLALKFAWRYQGAFDAVVFQRCGQRPAAVIGVELATSLRRHPRRGNSVSGKALSTSTRTRPSLGRTHQTTPFLAPERR